jgi:Protein of unknown function (DUF3800)
MTLTAVFDESGKYLDSEHVVFAGFIAEQVQWDRLTHEWNTRLRQSLPMRPPENNVIKNPALHMVELNRRYVRTEDGDKREIEALVGDLAALICKYALEGFANSITVKDFNRLSPDLRKRFKDPFYYAFEAGIKTITESRAVSAPLDNVMLICDDSDEYSSQCLESYRRLKRKQTVIAQKIPCITFADDKQYAPLQAADMYAYCVRARLVGSPNGLWNKPLGVLHSHFSDHIHSDILLKDGEVEPGLNTSDLYSYRRLKAALKQG